MEVVKTNMDDLFEEIFGFKPKKRGTGYELLVSAVIKILNDALDVTHNVIKAGQYSEDKYQLDALVESEATSIFIECKDNTEKNKLTGRSDIQKLAGALNNLDIDAGILVSATGFTKPTAQYAKSTETNPKAKEIKLFLIRPSTKEDTEGMMLSLCLSLSMQTIDQENSKVIPIMDKQKIRTILKKNGYKVGDAYNLNTHRLLKEDKTTYKLISEIVNDRTINPSIDSVSKGEFEFDEKVYLSCFNEMVEVEKLIYEVRHKTTHIPEFVKIEDKAILKVKTEDGQIDRIITEEQLKGIIFKDDGSIEYRGRY